MKNPLIINIRCTCIEEYVRMLDLHEQFRKQKSEGEILSIYVGATPAMYGKSPLIDKMLDKVFGDGCKPIPTERLAKEKVIAAQGNGDGTITETVERTFVPPEKPLTVDEARAIGAGYAEQEEELVGCEEPVPDQMWKKGKEDYSFRPEPAQDVPAVEPKPEITLTDVLTAMAEEPDPMEAIKTEAEGEPDGADWSTSAGC